MSSISHFPLVSLPLAIVLLLLLLLALLSAAVRATSILVLCHDVFKLRPQGLDRRELVADLHERAPSAVSPTTAITTLRNARGAAHLRAAAAQGREARRGKVVETHRDDGLQGPVQLVDVGEDVFEALHPRHPPKSVTLLRAWCSCGNGNEEAPPLP